MFCEAIFRVLMRRIVAALPLAVVLTLTAVLGSGPTVAGPTTADSSFGSGGRTLTHLVGSTTLDGANAAAMVVQPDGKIIVVGTCGASSLRDFCLIRYLANGTLDAGFGSAGVVITAVTASNDDSARSVALQSDGKIVVVGACMVGSNSNFCSVRYLPNGGVDVFFGVNGRVVTAFSGHSSASAVVIQPDGKILVGGSCPILSGLGLFCAARYDTNGSLDATFGASGTLSSSIGSQSGDFSYALALAADGKFVLAGECFGGAAGYGFCAARYTANGSLDVSFGTGGKVFTSISTVGNSSGYSLLIQPDDKIVLAGSCAAGSSVYRFCAARYQKNGALDTAFGSAGIAFPTLTVLSRSDRLRTAALQADGRILLVGSCDLGTATATDAMFCAARLNADGVIDASFGTLGGRMAYRMTSPGQSYATTAALQADGKILIAGTCVNSASDFCAIRFEGGPFGYTACSLDIDGDGQQNGSTDTTILARIGSGLRGSAVLAGLSFAPNAKRSTWPQVRDFLVKQCGMSLVQ